LNTRQIGTYYEDAAVAYLQNEKVEIIDRNVRCGRIGEIDLIGIDRGESYGETLVFFEIKYRKDNSHGEPLEAVDIKKQRTIRRCAQWYIAFKNEKRFMRFDVISICGEKITWLKNAF